MEQSELGKGDVDLKKSFVGGDRRNVLKSSGSATSVSGVLNFLYFLLRSCLSETSYGSEAATDSSLTDKGALFPNSSRFCLTIAQY